MEGTKEEIVKLKGEIDKYNAAYMTGTPIISDEEYDRLQERYVSLLGENTRLYTRDVQTDSVKALVGTLPKVYGVTETMRPDQRSYVEWMNTVKISPDSKVIVQPKFDGCSVAYDSETHQYFKRGDYDDGESEEVTDVFKDSWFVDKHRVDDMCDGIKFELIMCIETFYNFHSQYETERDATAGMLKRGTIAEYGTLVPLRELVDKKIYVAPSLKDISLTTTAGDIGSIQRFINDLLSSGACVQFGYHYPSKNYPDKMAYTSGTFRCDGVVVSVLNDDESIMKEIAIKIIHDVHEAKLIDIQYQLGNTGKITPVAKITPTSFADGKRTVSSITLSTLKRVQQLNLRHNDTVRVMYNIVPYLIDSKHDGDLPFNIPHKCPVCGAKLDITHLETVRCMNPDCVTRKIGDITRYVIQMRMLGISKATITKLYESGLVTCISDLYRLTKEDIISLDGYKDRSADNIIRTIRAASQDCKVSRWLGALPFKDVGSKKWDTILNQFIGNDELLKSNIIRAYVCDKPDEFVTDVLSKFYIDIGDATLAAINEGWMRNINEMREIIKHISFRVTTVSSTNVPITTYVTFTGCRDEDMVKWLRDRGVATIEFSTKTDYLIVRNKDYHNNKTAKATAKGIKILPIDEVYDFFEPF